MVSQRQCQITGNKAKADIQAVIKEYERQEIIFLSAAIGQQRRHQRNLCRAERYIDISNLKRIFQTIINTDQPLFLNYDSFGCFLN